LDVAVYGDLLFELLVKAGFEFAHFAATETGDMDMVAGAVSFVIVAVATEVEEIEFVDEAFLFEQVDGAVDSDEVDFRINLLSAFEDLIDVEMLLGGIHDLEDDAALACKTNAALTESILEMARGGSGVDAFASGNATRWSGGHGANCLTEKFSRKWEGRVGTGERRKRCKRGGPNASRRGLL
jgi:hypothetical protein